ncbi:Neutral/alkaline nonlysosomal ceramidase [Exidia glandulosa HHB12029]|uniref:Neutral ceramidase n=1 Tax=Exidia glandulosa HHB12029 TaxID=1314781 RepID=A0A165MJJ7_EXIGL|nr:Neutral/alkaline nonlysosomal ceramidase [Exidia glandulosa HHB12029]
MSPGIGDITGPIVETNMMGYASLGQTDSGLHMRQRARAFIVADASNPTDRVLFVNLDIGMGDTGIRRGILAKLQTLYNGTYNAQNTALVSTHSHSGVGGYVENLLPQLTSLGFVPLAYQAIVDGTVRAVQKAHANLAPGSLAVGNTTVQDGNANRSPFSYLQNPAEERARYTDDQDKDLSLLNFLGTDGTSRGFLSFYPVHGTSLYENNTLVSGDNKGMAAFLYESMVEPNAAPGNTTYVAGFAQANVGDTSPNVLGAFCESPGEAWDGQPCDFRTSTCGNRTEDCHGRGPGYLISDFESNRIIGDRQFQGAKKLVTQTKLAPVQGVVRSIHQYVDMTNYTFALANGTTVHTCPAAMGFSFAGGTTDGPGAFDFTQGNNNTEQNPLWEIVKSVINPIPSAEQVACHAPKPILLNTGPATFPYNWTPHVVDIQIFRIGNFVILIAPGEFTTMAGRRIREAMRAKLIKEGVIGEDAYVVIAGPANTYAHYITTIEEYAVQRYEGASTIYGPHTHGAYMDIYQKLTPYLAQNVPAVAPPNAPAPPDLTKNALSLQTGVVMDGTPSGKKFGDVLVDVKPSYTAGQTVLATFQGANPRNNLHAEGTYLTVDKLVSGSTFSTFRTDGHPSTKFSWLRTGGGLSSTSEVNVTWTIEQGTPAGTYRLSYFGESKPLIGSISSFSGHSSTFTVA